MTKLDAIAAAIVTFLPQVDIVDQRRWRGIKEAVERVHAKNVDEGVSSSSVRIGIDDLAPPEETMEVDPVTSEDGGDDDENEEGDSQPVEVVSPVRRSSRPTKKAEKAREVAAAEDDDEGGDNEGVGNTPKDSGVDGDKGPREKKKSMYLAYDASVHFYWDKAVRGVESDVILV